MNLTPKGVSGKDTCNALEHVNITCNKNGIPNDPLPPTVTSGIRLGSPAATSRGFDKAEFIQIGHWIAEVCDHLATGKATPDRIKKDVMLLCQEFPIYEGLRYV